MQRSFGLYFPLVISQGSVVYPGLVDSIDSSLRNIFSWTYGKRNFNPAFGSKLEDILGRGVTSETLFAIKMEIQRAVEEWEPRLESLQVQVEGNGSSVTATIKGKITNSQIPYTFEASL